MSWTFERVAGPYEMTEGPAWDGTGVLFTDIPTSRILRYDVARDETTVYATDTNASNGLTFGPDGSLHACERDGRRVVRYEDDGSRTTIADRFEGDRLTAPNDLVFDEQGSLWFSDPDYVGRGEEKELDHDSIYRADPRSDGSWNLVRATYDTTRPNGLLASADRTRLYVAESKYGEGNDRELRSYPIHRDGSLGTYEVLHNFYPHRGIDGMCLDEDGKIIATAGSDDSGPGPMLYVFEPGGRVLATHPFPGDAPTNCAFGDDDLQSLYVTSHDGCLYRARTDRTGYPGPTATSDIRD
jgi:gluconolactonase